MNGLMLTDCSSQNPTPNQLGLLSCGLHKELLSLKKLQHF